MNEWILGFSMNHEYLVYLFIVIFACLEGPILSILFGVFIRAGLFHFLPVYGALMFGDLLGDVGWYYIGRYFGNRFVARFGKYLNITEEKIVRVSDIFHKHKDKILLISKITNGFGLSLGTLITAGMIKIPFVRYLVFNLFGQFVWTGFLIIIGYEFGELYTKIDTWFGRFSIIGFLILLYFAYRGYKNYIKTKVENVL